MDIKPGREGRYPVNRFCERCLVNNYKYVDADLQPKEKFVCPRCRGLENPNKRCGAPRNQIHPHGRVCTVAVRNALSGSPAVPAQASDYNAER